MGRAITRRDAVAGVTVGALALGAAETASAATETVRGSWRITPEVPAGAPAFSALAAFGAGGIFITTGSDEPGTGIGQWEGKAKRGFKFAYTNFHFDSSGALSSVVNVKATGSFHGNKMNGSAELRRLDADGNPIGSPR
ncbi:MAG: hypothetical protein QOG63_1909, partial [Thermoleophilaceae bacterium]|nr:hypothetical protein [Thermoleophilaceae bacterium]